MADMATAPKSQIVSKLRSAQSRIRRLKESTESAVAVAITSVTVSGSAGLTGFLRGRMSDASGEWKIKKVPVELLLAAAAHVGGAVMSSQLARTLHTVGDGPLAFWAGMKGYTYGLEYKEKHPKTEGRRIPQMNGAQSRVPHESAQRQQTATGWR